MEIQPRQPTVKAGSDIFTGDAWIDNTDEQYLGSTTEATR